MPDKFLILDTVAETQTFVDTINNDMEYTGKGEFIYTKAISHSDGRGACLTCDDCRVFMTDDQIASLKNNQEMVADGWFPDLVDL